MNTNYLVMGVLYKCTREGIEELPATRTIFASSPEESEFLADMYLGLRSPVCLFQECLYKERKIS